MQEYIVLIFAIFIGMFFLGPIGGLIAFLLWLLIKAYSKH